MLNLSLTELKQITKTKRIKGYKAMSKERLLNALDDSESAKSLDYAKMEKIKEDFNKLKNRFLKPKIKEIRKNLYEIKNKNLSESETEEIEKNLLEVEKGFSNFKKYHPQDDFQHKKLGELKNLFNQSNDENYYKPIRTKNAFNNNCIEYESNSDKDKHLRVKKYLRMIRSYLIDIINDHKTLKQLRVYSSNEVFDYETQCGEWKIQLTMLINFASSKDSDKTHNINKKYTKPYKK